MVDKKQVVYDIERCICYAPGACRDCSKYKEGQPSVICMDELLTDALSMLKEYKAEFVEINDSDGGKTHCHECGRAVKWE